MTGIARTEVKLKSNNEYKLFKLKSAWFDPANLLSFVTDWVKQMLLQTRGLWFKPQC